MYDGGEFEGGGLCHRAHSGPGASESYGHICARFQALAAVLAFCAVFERCC